MSRKRPSDSNEMVTVLEAARLIERSPNAVRKYIRQGMLPAERKSGKLMISKRDLLSFSLQGSPGSYTQLNRFYFIQDDLWRRDRLLFLLRSDAIGVMHRLISRKDEICQIWSRDRLRKPFLQTLRTRYHEVSPETLMTLSVSELKAFQAFYDEVERLTWYLEYTQDMPGTLEAMLNQSLNRLRKRFLFLLKTLGEDQHDLMAFLEESIGEQAM